MPITYFTISKTKLILEDNPIATPGNEGSVHKILGNTTYSNCCAKIYHINRRTPAKKKKVEFMITNKPSILQSSNYIICWPTELLFDHLGKFIGFIMPLAYSDSVKLYELATVKMNIKLRSLWSKFERTTRGGIEKRLKICVNIAIALHAIHQNKKYALIDYKPQNILITKEGKISITDVDSFQISDNGIVLHHAEVATPEYIPPEALRLNPGHQFIPDSWDRFSIAVSFYELLLGIHPYAATCNGQYHNATTIGEKIQKGLFVHGSKKSYLSVIPPLHSNFQSLPPAIRRLFIDAFENGHTNAEIRPTAEKWGQAIVLELSRGTNVLPNPITINSRPKAVSIKSSQQNKTLQSIPQPLTNSTATKSDAGMLMTILIIVLIVLGVGYLINSNSSSKQSSSAPSIEVTNNYPYDEPMIDSTVTVVDSSANFTNEPVFLPTASYIDENGRFIYHNPCYVIITGAFSYEQDAKIFVQQEKSKGYFQSGYLWIPDFASLSGKTNFATILGAYQTRVECETALKSLTPTGIYWYGKKVSNSYDSDEIQLESGISGINLDDYGISPMKAVESFFGALKNQECENAWNSSQSPVWDSKGKEWFCSYEAFGTITNISIQDQYLVSQNTRQATIFIHYYSEDNFNGNFWFKQYVVLEKILQSGGHARWMIVRLKNFEPPAPSFSN